MATDFASLADDIRSARDLDALSGAVNRFWAEAARVKAESDSVFIDPTLEHYGVSMADAPTFGGVEPRDTSCVWSWDERRVRVGDGAPFQVEERDPEAWYA